MDGVVLFTWRLVQRLLSVGEVTVDDRLAMRGIFVGVSFEVVGDVELGTAPEGKCMDCDEERRMKGMEEGVRYFDGPDPWCKVADELVHKSDDDAGGRGFFACIIHPKFGDPRKIKIQHLPLTTNAPVRFPDALCDQRQRPELVIVFPVGEVVESFGDSLMCMV